MDKKESLELYTKGVETWNCWANRLLAQRDKLMETGQWMPSTGVPLIVELDLSGDNQLTQDWLDIAKVDFSGYSFEVDADFTNFIFPSAADFRGVVFKSRAGFSKAKFMSYTQFEAAHFNGHAGFGRTTFSGVVSFNRVTFGDKAHFGRAEFGADTWFEEAVFEGEAHFMRNNFVGTARFNNASFNSEAEFLVSTFTGVIGGQFNGTKFNGMASFEESSFPHNAEFEGAEFMDVARFTKAIFGGTAWFTYAKFIGGARFDRAVFQDYTSFQKTLFKSISTFSAIKVQGFFSLKEATFLSVPHFGQAHFAEAPQLDDIHLSVDSRLLQQSQSPNFTRDTAARWRALKRLAIQGHDHERELIFMAEEIKSLRGVRDRLLPNPFRLRHGEPIWLGGGRYWYGLLYQWFSDFGRSTARPLLWWMLITGVFAFYFHYLSPHSDLDSNDPLSIASCSGSDPVTAALYLSVNNGLVISGLGRTEKLAQSYACLYGSDEKDRISPIMPDAVVFAGIAQTIFSAVLIFLFLLGLRNYFRIK